MVVTTTVGLIATPLGTRGIGGPDPRHLSATLTVPEITTHFVTKPALSPFATVHSAQRGFKSSKVAQPA